MILSLLLLLLLNHFSRADSVQPHRRQPTRLLRPWDSPCKNTGVGCHFLLQCMKVKSESEVTQSCPTPSDPMDCSLPSSSVHGIFQARVLEWGAIALSGSYPKSFIFLTSTLNFLRKAKSSKVLECFKCQSEEVEFNSLRNGKPMVTKQGRRIFFFSLRISTAVYRMD